MIFTRMNFEETEKYINLNLKELVEDLLYLNEHGIHRPNSKFLILTRFCSYAGSSNFSLAESMVKNAALVKLNELLK